MTVITDNPYNQNRLIKWIFAGSLLVHILFLFYVPAIYQTTELSVIEFNLQQASAPSTRSIPRPKMLNNLPETSQATQLEITERIMPIPDIAPLEFQAKDLPTEGIFSPAPERLTANLSIGNPGNSDNYFTPNDYMDVLRLKIENRKIYPEDARKKHIEGKVVVQFLITRDGQISSLKIIKSAGFGLLDQAALNAVQNAGPFSPPPQHLFSGPLRLELAIVFEIT